MKKLISNKWIFILFIIFSFVGVILVISIISERNKNNFLEFKNENLKAEVGELSQQVNDFNKEQYLKIENKQLLEDCLEESKNISSYQYESLCPGILSGKDSTCRGDMTTSQLSQAFDVIESSKKDRDSTCFKKYPQ